MPVRKTFAVIAGLLSVGIGHSETEVMDAFILEVEASNPRGGLMEVFYDIGRDYNHSDWIAIELPPDEELRTYRFELAASPIKRIRIDPAQSETVMRIGQIHLFTPDGDTLASWGPDSLAIMNQIDSIRTVDDLAVLTIPAGSNDPMIFLKNPPFEVTIRWLERKLIGMPGVIALAGLLASALSLAWFGALTTVAPLWRSDNGKRVGLATASAFVFVLGCRLVLLNLFSSPVPFWDEWDSDIHFLILPFQGNFLDWSALLEQQSEHRILVTRIITLVGFILNGEFDPRIGMLAGAIMWSATIAVISAGAFSQLPSKLFPALIPFWIVAALPFDYLNLTWGGQSQMYALGLTATCVLALATTVRPTRFQFLAAGCASTASLFTMGSGFVAPLLAGCLFFFRSIRSRSDWRIRLGYGAVFVGAGVVGLLTYEKSPRHAPVYAETASQFWHAFEGYASWPFSSSIGAVLIIWLPWVILTVMLTIWKGQSKRTACGWLGIGLGCWTLCHVVGLAYSRPELSNPVMNRYFTSLFTPTSTAICAAAYLATRQFRPFASIAIIALAAINVLAIGKAGLDGVKGARAHAARQTVHADIVVEYLSTGERELLADLPLYRTPYWNSNELAARLESPAMVQILPSELRQNSQVLDSNELQKPKQPSDDADIGRAPEL